MESWNLNEMDQKKNTKKNDRNKRNPKNEMKENDMRQRGINVYIRYYMNEVEK